MLLNTQYGGIKNVAKTEKYRSDNVLSKHKPWKWTLWINHQDILWKVYVQLWYPSTCLGNSFRNDNSIAINFEHQQDILFSCAKCSLYHAGHWDTSSVPDSKYVLVHLNHRWYGVCPCVNFLPYFQVDLMDFNHTGYGTIRISTRWSYMVSQ